MLLAALATWAMSSSSHPAPSGHCFDSDPLFPLLIAHLLLLLVEYRERKKVETATPFPFNLLAYDEIWKGRACSVKIIKGKQICSSHGLAERKKGEGAINCKETANRYMTSSVCRSLVRSGA